MPEKRDYFNSLIVDLAIEGSKVLSDLDESNLEAIQTIISHLETLFGS